MSTIRLPVGSLTGGPTDRGGHRLLDQIGLAGPCSETGFLDGPLLHTGHPRRNAHDDPGVGEAAVIGPLDEVAEHRFGDLKVGDHAVLERSHRVDRRGRPSEHLLRLGTDGVHLARRGVDRDDRGLRDDDASAADVDERVGRS